MSETIHECKNCWTLCDCGQDEYDCATCSLCYYDDYDDDWDDDDDGDDE